MLSRKLPTISKVLFSSLRCMSTINSIPIRNTQMLIDGKFVNATSGKTFETINPATEEVIATIAEGQAVDIDIAVQAARKAFDYGTWPKTSGRERAKKLYKLAELIQQHSEELAILESLDNGKPLHNAKNDVTLTWDHFQYYAGWADKMQGKTIPVDGDFLSYTLNEPIGVCGQIIPWNFPIVMAAWKLAPALAVGNTVVLKVAEQTPLSALRLGELILEAGIPEGVVNIVTGFGETAGTALALHHDVDKLAFTGSTAVGQEIMKMAGASNLKPVTLELGGKSASIVMDDIEDLDLAIDQTHFGLFFNQGQCCCAGSRIYVHEKIYDEYIEKMTSKIKKTVVGDPFNEETNQGPQVSAEQMDKILGYIKSGTEEGAKIITGGERHGNKGYFVQPTLFTDVQDEMKISKEEIFGPVMNVMKFSSTDEVIKRANQSNYGLAAGIWTSNIDTANTMSRALRAGTVWINCYDHFDSAVPFGGYKMSGIGREKGEYALENYTQVKCVTTPLKNPAWL